MSVDSTENWPPTTIGLPSRDALDEADQERIRGPGLSSGRVT